MTELPAELLDPGAPKGTPVGQQAAKNLAPVWCRHGVRWSPQQNGYEADDAADPSQLGHDIPAREVGAIPATCHPTTTWDPADKPDAVLKRELVEEKLRAEGIDPGGPLL